MALCPQFYGASCSDDYAAAMAVGAGPGLSVKTFPNGLLAHGPGLAVHERDGDLCIAMGRPRFLERDAAERAATEGPAAAWMAAFDALGADAPKRVADRFAVVLIQPHRGTLTFATDRFATWPICYAAEAGELFFASRADRVPGRGAIALQSVFSYLLFHVVPSPDTIFAGVRRMLPGNVLVWREGRMELRSYWQPQFQERPTMGLKEAEETFRALVREAVAREAASGPVGAFLSGGTDSSTISGMLSQLSSTPPKTYSIGFDVEGYDEMRYARIAAQHFRTDHHEYYVTPDDIEAGIRKVVAYSDEPFGNSSAVPALICAERAKADGTEKLLAGDGGDELFGGNTRYAKQRVFGWYGALPEAVRSAVLEPLLRSAVARRTPLVKKASSYVEQARVSMPDRLHSYNLLTRIGLTEVLTPEFLGAVDVERPFAAQRDWWASIASGSDVNKMLALDWKYTLVDSDLPKVIGATSGAGVDVAFPFLSDELVSFSSKLDPNWKLKGLTLRWFFKKALADFLPKEILSKKKHGFGLPFGAWACSHAGLARLSAETLRQFAERGIVRRDFVRQLVTKLLPAHPSFYGELVWILIILELWLQQRAPDFRVS